MTAVAYYPILLLPRKIKLNNRSEMLEKLTEKQLYARVTEPFESICKPYHDNVWKQIKMVIKAISQLLYFEEFVNCKFTIDNIYPFQSIGTFLESSRDGKKQRKVSIVEHSSKSDHQRAEFVIRNWTQKNLLLEGY